MPDSKPLLEFGKNILSEQPISALLGTHLDTLIEGYASLSLPITHKIQQQHGFVHGGIIGYLADNALYFAATSCQGDSVTSEYKINYLRPAIGEKLIARAKVISSGKRQSVCLCEVFSLIKGEEKLVAIAQGTIIPVDAKRVHQ